MQSSIYLNIYNNFAAIISIILSNPVILSENEKNSFSFNHYHYD